MKNFIKSKFNRASKVTGAVNRRVRAKTVLCHMHLVAYATRLIASSSAAVGHAVVVGSGRRLYAATGDDGVSIIGPLHARDLFVPAAFDWP